MEPQANEQRQPLLLFTVITLNTNKLADLAFLPTLLKENRPDFVFLQEVSVPVSPRSSGWSGVLRVAVFSRSSIVSHCCAVSTLNCCCHITYSRVPAKSDF